MAITKTRSVQRIEVYPKTNSEASADTTNEGNPSLFVLYENTFDDSEDDSLPAVSPTSKSIDRYVITTDTDSDGNPTETVTATDVTGEDQLVQDVCAAIWPTN